MKDIKTKSGPDSTRRALTLSVLGAGVLALPACGGGGDDEPQDVTHLRFANATVNHNPIVFRIDGVTATSLSNAGGVSHYGDTAAGASTIAVRAPNTSTDLASINTTLVKDRSVTALAYGNSSAGGGGVKLRMFEEVEAQPDAGNTKIRVFHAASGRSTLNVYFTTLTGSLPSQPMFVLTTYENLTAFTTMSVGAGYRIRIQEVTTGSPQTVFDSGGTRAADFASRSVVTLVVVPSNDSGKVNLAVLPEQAIGGQIANNLP